jgi:hypothetical protein
MEMPLEDKTQWIYEAGDNGRHRAGSGASTRQQGATHAHPGCVRDQRGIP